MVLILRTPVLVEQKRTLQGSRRKPVELATAEPTVADVAVDNQQEFNPPAPDSAELLVREQMLVEQSKQVEAAMQSAFEDGYAAGFRKGEQDGLAGYQSAQTRLDAVARSIDDASVRSVEIAQDLIVATAFEAICKILGDGFSTPEGIRALVKEATSRIRGKSPLTIKVNPDDLKLIEVTGELGVATESTWQSDETLNIGGCLIESKQGTLDAQLDSQILRLKQILMAARRTAPKG